MPRLTLRLLAPYLAPRGFIADDTSGGGDGDSGGDGGDDLGDLTSAVGEGMDDSDSGLDDDAAGGDPAGDEPDAGDEETGDDAGPEDADPEGDELDANGAPVAKPDPNDPTESWTEPDGTVVSAKRSEIRAAFAQRAQSAEAIQEGTKAKTEAQGFAQNVLQRLQQAHAQHQAIIQWHQRLTESMKPDPALMRTDLPAYMEQQLRYTEHMQQFNGVLQQAQAVTGQAQAISEADRQRFNANEAQLLLQKMPTWRNPAVARSEMGKIHASLSQVGYMPQEIEGMTDHRAYLVALKAAKWDALQATGNKRAPGTPAAKPPTPTRVVKPGATTSRGNNQTVLKARAEKRLEANPDSINALAGAVWGGSKG